MQVLVLKGISKRFCDDQAEFQALSDISCVIHKGEIVCLMGPSGCGKSTVLRILSGLESSDSGTICGSDGDVFDPVHTAMVFQEHGLFPWLSVYDNIAYGLRMKVRKIPQKQIAQKVHDLLSLVHMEEFANVLPHQLSGGMKQRVAVARALAIEPEILLMDEPFSALDPFSRHELQDEVIRIRDTLGTTFFIVTHNPEEAVYLGDRIIILSKRPSSVRKEIEVSSPRPRDLAEPEMIHLVREVTGYVSSG
ncbi:ABC transporter ATP-binding protein [Methanospirillum hungatei]|uniref:ABC transporter ATP-binding protein n=1 Tax=Methanospirillum hungatei TaxID=2203 RepID=UPI0026F2926F|nr:ABC transporter ATP-binding protein [Methanospirillum hungatei]MCA1916725.1 ABC transporter ATP-binding protein [Methanospirillum hungatei]